MKRKGTKLAILMTSHNRRLKTLACLEGLAAQRGVEGIEISVYLVDDGSTDGTSEAVAARFPEVNVFEGDGSLYWTGGMRKAMDASRAEGFAYYLWVNDDIVLDADALVRMFSTHDEIQAKGHRHPIVVGSFCDPDDGRPTYGGSKSARGLHPLRFELIPPTEAAQACDVFNGNLVLLPAPVVAAVGGLTPRLRHRGADYEFALRSRKHGFTAWIAPGYFGTCARNPVAGTWLDRSLPAAERLRRLLGPKGSPVRERLFLMSRYGGPLWPLHFGGIYVRFFLDLVIGRRRS